MRSPTALSALALLGIAAPALGAGTPLPLDPGPPFTLYTLDTNDGYFDGRGMVFTADEAITVNGAALWTADAAGLSATFDLYEVVTTSGNVLAGATLLRSAGALLSGPIGFHGTKFTPVTLTPGQDYLVRVSYPDNSDENWFYDFDPVVFGDPPVDIGPVTLIDGEHAGDTSNFVAPYMQLQLVEGGAPVNFFTDPAAFQVALEGAGKVAKAVWDFKPHNLPPGGVVGLDDPLDINTHGLNPDDPWTSPKGNLWPPEVDNVQFVGNTTPQGPLTPQGIDGIAFAAAGFAGSNNNAVASNFFVNSLAIVSGPPAGDNHTAIGLELVNFFAGGLIHVTVYDKDDLELAKFDVEVPPPPGKAFLGILRKDRETIGRLDLWDPNQGAEGVSSIALYQNLEECTVFNDKGLFEEFNLAHGKVLKGFEDFDSVSNVPPGAVACPIPDPLQGNVPGLDPNGLGFPEGLANKNLFIQSNLLGINAPVPAPGQGLAALGTGAFGNNSVVVGSCTFVDSTDLIFDPLENHTGVGFDVIDPIGLNAVHITVFNKQEQVISKEVIPVSDQKTFFGIWCEETIGRINIAGVDVQGNGTGELVDNIQMWLEAPPCPWDCNGDGVVNIVDLIDLLGRWGPCAGCCQDHNGDGVVNIVDLIKLLANWGPCPVPSNCDTPGVCGTYVSCDPVDPNCFCFTLADGTPFCGQSVSCAGLVACPAGTCPPGFVCQVDTCCPDADICVPIETKCPGGAASAPSAGTPSTARPAASPPVVHDDVTISGAVNH